MSDSESESDSDEANTALRRSRTSDSEGEDEAGDVEDEPPNTQTASADEVKGIYMLFFFWILTHFLIW